eukprot:TRINITY_DN5193_c0_g1_i2.p1 TRINITY_DN5193_c0_g1~~TRINITY_DN5193_c0_g1_i2.p1  ORF type:complete len:224 (-),score=14.62 TRINITY_DN5193_c0_g1_i2:53-724(-)
MEDETQVKQPSHIPGVTICKHWARRKFCYYEDKCKYLHPPDTIPTDPLVKVVTSGKRNHETRKQNRGVKRRNRIRNLGKASVFRRFIIDTFGWEPLKKGVLDIAGGQGELAFELVNLCGVPCTVIDPRELRLIQWEKRLYQGMYWRNPIFQSYNPRTKEVAQASGPIPPKHYRIFFGDYLWNNTGDDEESKNKFYESACKAMRVLWTEKGTYRRPFHRTYSIS